MTSTGSRIHTGTGVPRLLWTFSLFSCVLLVPASSAGEPFDLDSILALPCIPDWVVYGQPPLLGTSEPAAVASPGDGCTSIFEMGTTQDNVAYHFDEDLQVTEMFAADYYGVRGILRHEIDAFLNHEVTELPVPYGKPWLAVDLDLDGNIELVIQRGDPGGFGGNGYLDIISAPDWELRAHFVFPGMKIYMRPIAANIDEDPFLEVYFTPHGFGLAARAVIVDYDPTTDSFIKRVDIAAPAGTGGTGAAGDFDDDGLMEFVSGNIWGYGLFEYDGVDLTLVGQIVQDSVWGANYTALACRPKPGGVLHVLLAHSSGENGFRYQLWEPAGDNQFSLVYTFQEITGWAGPVFPGAADIDCDGLDELSMLFYPRAEAVFEWDEGLNDFVEGCTWDPLIVGSFGQHEASDLNQNGALEWTTVNPVGTLRSFEDSRCDHCARPRSGMVAWWPLDETPPDNAIDIWGGMNGSPVGNPVSEAGMVGSALSFDGQGDYVRVPDAAALDLGTGDLSVEAWIRTTSTAPMNPLVAKYDPATDRGWIVWIADGTRPGFETSIVGGVQYPEADPQGLADGAWHHVAVTVDRDDPEGLKFYIDGTLIGPGIPPGGSDDFDNTADLLIATASPSVGDTIYFEGSIDELTIYDRVLEAYEIEDIHRVGPTGKCTNAFTACDCSNHGDVTNNDKTLDVTDVVTLVDHVFRNGPRPQTDLTCPHRDRGDLNCDGIDDVLDVVTLVEIAFRNSTRPICNPCGCDPYPDGCR